MNAKTITIEVFFGQKTARNGGGEGFSTHVKEHNMNIFRTEPETIKVAFDVEAISAQYAKGGMYAGYVKKYVAAQLVEGSIRAAEGYKLPHNPFGPGIHKGLLDIVLDYIHDNNEVLAEGLELPEEKEEKPA